MNAKASSVGCKSRLQVRTGLRPEATRDIAGALNALLADCFALYLSVHRRRRKRALRFDFSRVRGCTGTVLTVLVRRESAMAWFCDRLSCGYSRVTASCGSLAAGASSAFTAIACACLTARRVGRFATFARARSRARRQPLPLPA